MKGAYNRHWASMAIPLRAGKHFSVENYALVKISAYAKVATASFSMEFSK